MYDGRTGHASQPRYRALTLTPLTVIKLGDGLDAATGSSRRRLQEFGG